MRARFRGLVAWLLVLAVCGRVGFVQVESSGGVFGRPSPHQDGLSSGRGAGGSRFVMHDGKIKPASRSSPPSCGEKDIGDSGAGDDEANGPCTHSFPEASPSSGQAEATGKVDVPDSFVAAGGALGTAAATAAFKRAAIDAYGDFPRGIGVPALLSTLDAHHDPASSAAILAGFSRPYSAAVYCSGKVMFALAPLTGKLFERYYAGDAASGGWLFAAHPFFHSSSSLVAITTVADRGHLFATDGAGRLFQRRSLGRCYSPGQLARLGDGLPVPSLEVQPNKVEPAADPASPGSVDASAGGASVPHQARRAHALQQQRTFHSGHHMQRGDTPDSFGSDLPHGHGGDDRIAALGGMAGLGADTLPQSRVRPSSRGKRPARRTRAQGSDVFIDGVLVRGSTSGRTRERRPAENTTVPAWKDLTTGSFRVLGGGVETPFHSVMFVNTFGELAEFDWEESEWHVADLFSHRSDLRVVIDAYSLKAGSIFALTDAGMLVERLPSSVWVSHGHPLRNPLSLLPGVVVKEAFSIGSMFFRSQAGTLVEYAWSKQKWSWQWVAHGTPDGATVMTAPGAAINRTSLFVVGSDGALHERQKGVEGWTWVLHKLPQGISSRLAFIRPIALHDNLVVTFLANGDLVDLVHDGSAWSWSVLRTPESKSVPASPDSPTASVPQYVCPHLHDLHADDQSEAAIADALNVPGCIDLWGAIAKEEAQSSRSKRSGRRSKGATVDPDGEGSFDEHLLPRRSQSSGHHGVSMLKAMVHPLMPDSGRTVVAPGPWRPSYPEELSSSLVSAIAPSVFCLSLTGSIFERFFNDVQWVYVSHMNPSDEPVVALTTVRGGSGTFFAADLAGRLFQRIVDTTSDYSRLKWTEVTRPASSFYTGGTQSNAGNLFFVDAKGVVLERDLKLDTWRVVTGPMKSTSLNEVTASMAMALVVDAYTLKEGSLWTITVDGSLMELESCCGWTRHGHPPQSSLALISGVSLRDLNAIGSMFFRTADGNLVEYWWNSSSEAWEWVSHGHPEDATVMSAPGALIHSVSMFMVGSNGKLYERHWNNGWQWVDHGRPAGARLAYARPVHLNDQTLICMVTKGNLAGRVWTGDRWEWEVYSVPLAGIRDFGDLTMEHGDVAKYCSTDPLAPDNCVRGWVEGDSY